MLAASNAAAQPATAPAAPPAAPTPPSPQLQFDRMPNATDFGRNYPPRAQYEGVEGRAVLGCTVGADGSLQNCSVVSEDPPNYGFGPAVLAMAGLFRVNMRTA